MTEDILVSVIIPIYNTEGSLLRRCVTSVAEQTYDSIEIILVDDGSNAETAALTDSLAEELKNNGSMSKGKTIEVIHRPNGGSSAARNTGLKQAHGEYIGFVDSDDYVEEDHVRLMMDAIDRLKLKMAQTSRDEIAADGSRLPDVCTPPESELLITSEEQMRELLLHRGDCSFCTRLTHRSLFEGKGFPEGKLNEDFRLLTEMLADIDTYVILPKQTYHVYYSKDSNSRSDDKDVFKQVYADIVDNADFAEKLVSDRYPELMKEAQRFALIQRLDYLLHVPIGMMTRDNAFYTEVVQYLRDNKGRIFSNKYLTIKNKIYLILLTIAPAQVRKIHRKIRG